MGLPIARMHWTSLAVMAVRRRSRDVDGWLLVILKAWS